MLPWVGGSFNTVIGVVFLLIVLISPGGLMGIWERVSPRVGRRPRRAASPKAARSLRKEDNAAPSFCLRRDINCTRNRRSNYRRRATPDEKTRLRGWRAIVPLGIIACGLVFATSASLAAQTQGAPVRVAIMTDCKGGFGFGYELDIGGAQAAFEQYAGGKVEEQEQAVGRDDGHQSRQDTPVNIVGYGCGDDTAATAIKETRRLMQQLDADVMVGPLSGDEAVAIANWAKANPTKTVIIGTAGSQDPTMQIAPKNVFRYFGDGAQWNAGIGEIMYKRLGWRNAAIIMDDYSFGWTSAAGMIADFCAVGGKITKRVFPPLNNADYAAFIRQLPPPTRSTATSGQWAVTRQGA